MTTLQSQDAAPSTTVEPYLMSVLSSRLYCIGIEMTNTMIRSARSLLMSICATNRRRSATDLLPPCIPVHCANMGSRSSPPSSILRVSRGRSLPQQLSVHGQHPSRRLHVHRAGLQQRRADVLHRRQGPPDCGNSIPAPTRPPRGTSERRSQLALYQDPEGLQRRLRHQDRHEPHPRPTSGTGLSRRRRAARIGERRLRRCATSTATSSSARSVTPIRIRLAAHRRRDPQASCRHLGLQHQARPDPRVLPGGVDIYRGDGGPGGRSRSTCGTTPTPRLRLNLCEATTLASVRAGVLNRMAPDAAERRRHAPHQVLMREGASSQGEAPLPSSVATTIADRLISGVQCLMNQIRHPRHGRRGAVQCPAVGHLRQDWRRNDEPYVNQLFCGMTGGPRVRTDGWITISTRAPAALCTGPD